MAGSVRPRRKTPSRSGFHVNALILLVLVASSEGSVSAAGGDASFVSVPPLSFLLENRHMVRREAHEEGVVENSDDDDEAAPPVLSKKASVCPPPTAASDTRMRPDVRILL